MNRRKTFLILFLLAIVLFVLWFRLENRSRASANRPIAVTTATVTTANVPVYLSALGTVTPVYSAQLRSQVGGILTNIYFKEGGFVKAGQVVAQVDVRPYRAQLTQFEGQLARDQAQLVNAQIDLKRYQQLWKEDSISAQTLATQAALVKQLIGTVKLDEGLLENAKVNLFYTQIKAPFDGQIGLRIVDPGNLVQASDTNGIAIINKVNPINVIFSLPEDQVSAIKEAFATHRTLSVEAFDKSQNKRLAIGKLLTMDNQIDPTTGTFRLKAQFNNDQSLLFPNQFVNVRLHMRTLNKVAVIPTASIQYLLHGPTVYMVDDNHQVIAKTITVGPTVESQTAVLSGLTPDERIIVDSVDKLSPGMMVQVR